MVIDKKYTPLTESSDSFQELTVMVTFEEYEMFLLVFDHGGRATQSYMTMIGGDESVDTEFMQAFENAATLSSGEKFNGSPSPFRSEAGDIVEAFRMMTQMCMIRLKMDTVTSSNSLHNSCLERGFVDTYELLISGSKKRYTVDGMSYVTIIAGYFKEEIYDRAMKDTEIIHGLVTHNFVIGKLCKLGNTDLAINNKNAQKEIEQTRNLIRRLSVGVNSRRASTAEKKLEKLQDVEQVEKPLSKKQMKIRFLDRGRSGRLVVTLTLKFSYEDKVLFKHANLSIERGERIATLGPKGCRMSTLLKLIIGMEKSDKGEVLFWERNVLQNYFEQIKVEALVLDKTVQVIVAEVAQVVGVIMTNISDGVGNHYPTETIFAKGGSMTRTVSANFVTAFEVDEQLVTAVKAAFVKLASSTLKSEGEIKELLIKTSERTNWNSEVMAQQVEVPVSINEVYVQPSKSPNSSHFPKLFLAIEGENYNGELASCTGALLTSLNQQMSNEEEQVMRKCFKNVTPNERLLQLN